MARIRILPDQTEVESKPDETVLQASLRGHVPHVHACGGKARCSTCRVIVLEGMEHCEGRSAAEEKLVGQLFLTPEIRLACQTRLKAGEGQVVARRLVLDDNDIELTDTEFEVAAPGTVGDERKLAILFSDVRNFTAHSEALPPYDIVHLLNRYYMQMGRVVERYDGVINNYMGDGFMALFGLSGKSENPSLDAVRAGLDMLASVVEMQKYVAAAYQREFRIGIGVHYGEVVVGSIGSQKSRTMTAIGDSVNFASRIESANKEAQTEFLISETTYGAVADQIVVGKHFTVPVKGKAGEFRLYEVRGLK